MRNKIGILIAICLIPLFIVPAYAITETWVIEPNFTHTHILELRTGCIITASLTVDGGSNEIVFSLTGPEDEIIFPEQKVTNEVQEFFFKAKHDGEYKFHFSNYLMGGSEKLVKLSYDEDCPDIIGGCLIATATFGSELAPQVQMLREIRDNSLLQTQSGQSFMQGFNQFYYSFSPIIADYERQNPVFKEAVKLTITPLLASLSLLNYVDLDSEESVLGYGIGIILMNVGMYFVAPALIAVRTLNVLRIL